jgi:peroxin-11B
MREAYKAWFIGISFSIASSIYSLYKFRERAAKINEKEGEGAVERKKVAKYVSFHISFILR